MFKNRIFSFTWIGAFIGWLVGMSIGYIILPTHATAWWIMQLSGLAIIISFIFITSKKKPNEKN